MLVKTIVVIFLWPYAANCYGHRMACVHLMWLSFVDSAGRGRPKSLAISTPTRLLSLEEARERALSVGVNQGAQKYIEVGGGSATLPAQYHTVIDLPNK